MRTKISKSNIKNYIGLASRIQETFCDEENIDIGKNKAKKKLECINEYPLEDRQKAFELLCTNTGLIEHKRFDIIVEAFVDSGVTPNEGFEVAKTTTVAATINENNTANAMEETSDVENIENESAATIIDDNDEDDVPKKAPRLVNTTKEMEQKKGTIKGKISYNLEFMPKRAHSRMIELRYKFKRKFGMNF